MSNNYKNSKKDNTNNNNNYNNKNWSKKTNNKSSENISNNKDSIKKVNKTNKTNKTNNSDNNNNNKNYRTNKTSIYEKKYNSEKKIGQNNTFKNQISNKSSNYTFFKNRYNQIFNETNSLDLLIKEQEKLKDNLFIRINLSKTTIQKQEEFLIKNRVKYSKTFIENALKIEKSFFNLSSSIPALTGEIYIQDLASQIPVNLIDFITLKKTFGEKTVKILDMAASPGSKTTQIADLLNYHNINYNIIALESEKKRLNRLINNIQKQELENIEIINIKSEEYKSEDKFDIILLDAPCSGNLIDDKNWLDKRNLEGITNNSSLQKKLLKNAKRLLSKNGEIIYSTCSIEPEENEENVDWVLKNLNLKETSSKFKFPFKTQPIKKFEKQKSIRIMPQNSKTQGFFVSVLKN